MSTSTIKDLFKKYLCCCCPSPPSQASINRFNAYIDHSQIQVTQSMPDSYIQNRKKSSIQIDMGKRLYQLFSKKKNWQIVSASNIYEDKTCSICLVDKANIKLECNHYFHKACLWTWYKTKNSCPNCRRKTTNLDIFCEDCYYQFHKIPFQQAIKEKTVDQHGFPILSICDSCDFSRQKSRLIGLKAQQKTGLNR